MSFICFKYQEDCQTQCDKCRDINDSPRAEEIRKEARSLVDSWFPKAKYEKTCPVCGADNCINNPTCIQCNCQF